MHQKFDKSHLAAWQQSGLSQHAYCVANGISISTFSYWVSRQKQSSRPMRIVEVAAKSREWLTLSFGAAGFRIAVTFDIVF
jgi:elongation factor P hydroxylase